MLYYEHSINDSFNERRGFECTICPNIQNTFFGSNTRILLDRTHLDVTFIRAAAMRAAAHGTRTAWRQV